MEYPKSVGVYLREGKYYFQSSTRIVPHGPYIGNDYIISLDSNSGSEDLGKALLDAFKHSDWKKHPPENYDPKDNNSQLLKIMGVLSWDKIAFPDTKYIDCELRDGVYTLTPSVSIKTKTRSKGFNYKGAKDEIVINFDATNEQLGTALVQAFAKSE